MKGRPTIRMPLINSTFTSRATPDIGDDSHSSTSNSPARADYEESDFFTGNNDSQSSIGVPTFQDMAVTDACISASNRLPAEVLINIFAKLSHPNDLLSCMRVSKKWARNSVDLLWHRPACSTFPKLGHICNTLTLDNPYFAYRDFIKRLNLAILSERVSDGTVHPLSVCTRVERLTLTNCVGITDSGLTGLITDNSHLLALDISGVKQITETSMFALAMHCRRLQGLNITSCVGISSDSMVKVAESCHLLKRLKLNECEQLDDRAIMAFAQNCRNILEIDLHQCKLIGNDPITALIANGKALRELRLANCETISDNAFLNLPHKVTYDHLRILDLTSCLRLTDAAVEKIITVAPRLRNLVFAKCRLLTDHAVHSISKLGKNLHYLHLGHCGQITDAAVIRLVQSCNRIRYIDLGCCIHLTDASVTKLASLPKLRRIGLVKCQAITDESVMALAHAQRQRQLGHRGHHPDDAAYTGSCLERSIVELLKSCPKLTHLSLTGVQAFLRVDLEQFCREAPSEFSEHQRNVFCVFSGDGVNGLRTYLTRTDQIPNPDEDDVIEQGMGAQIIPAVDDDQTMTGMMNATAINTEENDADLDEVTLITVILRIADIQRIRIEVNERTSTHPNYQEMEFRSEQGLINGRTYPFHYGSSLAPQ
ncbi:SCF ubiquitin ligase complex subunit [Ciborinia camelliae]|nr:SCF ubiquitin ligase complex subunit [Ciborinia camelliae]